MSRSSTRDRRTWRATAFLLVALFTQPGPRASLAEDEAPRSTELLKVLSYNVHGLFRLAAKDDPAARMPTIGWLSRAYDVMLYQEDFEYHRELVAQLDAHADFLGNGVGGDARRILAKLIAVPFTMWIPHFSPPYGSGVSTAVHCHYQVVETNNGLYTACDGWFSSNGDCWASKGYLRVRLRTPGGHEIDFYNTHLESGDSPGSTLARRAQLVELADSIELHSSGRAVVVGGDLNVSYLRPGDRDMMHELRQRVGLADSGAGPQNPQWRERDFLLYRSGTAVDLAVRRAGEATEFISTGRALSDHPAIFVHLAVSGVSP